ncbi:MFS transporter [Nocardioides cavernaquae]|uniref:MFS transporter n=1 Tax=Nocardioides cavernaquae TaxID=2321396 RepID=A0A3A5H518_9ACTN|nr:MFS transporter [Nocardioides cavernaquae]RJS44958.1 MFS transporter [Nocardioides cavernaquae]
MSALADRVVPARLGDGVRRLLPAVWLTHVVDGVALAAGPLAVASVTHAPLPIALAVALQRVPFLLLGPYAAALADLAHRRTLVVVGNGLRACVLLLLALAIGTGHASVGGLLSALLVLGVLETVVDAATGPIGAMLVTEPDDLATLTDRVDAGFMLGTQLLGPALGALLFTVGGGVPFAAQASLLVLAAWVLSGLVLAGPARAAGRRRRSARTRRPIRTGLRRIAVDPALSALALAAMASQAAWAAGWSLLVLYAADQLGVGPVGFGLLISAGAAGGLAGVLLEDRIARLTAPGRLLRAGLLAEAVGYSALALTTVAWLAYVAVALLGVVAVVWSGQLRAERRARVAPVASEAVSAAVVALALSSIVAGCVAGGLLATVGGVAAAYWGAAAVSLAALGLLWRRLAAL